MSEAERLLEAFGRLRGTRLKSIDDPTIILPQAMTTNDESMKVNLPDGSSMEVPEPTFRIGPVASFTNDTPGEYGEQPKRDPMMTLETVRDAAMDIEQEAFDAKEDPSSYELTHRTIERLITEGRLMVVPHGKIGRILDPTEEHQLDCKKCGRCVGFMHVLMKCPECGNQPSQDR